jgi:hypothetical protein
LTIQVRYHVRDSFRKLFWQFAQYGYWKVRVVRKHPQQASVRHIVPATFVLLVLMGAVVAPFSCWARWAAVGLVGSYLAAVSLVSLVQVWASDKRLWPGLVVAVVTMHWAYGSGFVLGCLRAAVRPLPSDRFFEHDTR